MKQAEYEAERQKLQAEIQERTQQLHALDFLWSSRWKPRESPGSSASVRVAPKPAPTSTAGMSTLIGALGAIGEALSPTTPSPVRLMSWRDRVRHVVGALPVDFSSTDVMSGVVNQFRIEANDSNRATISSTLGRLEEEGFIRKIAAGMGGKPTRYARITAPAHSNKEGTATR